ncbi:uncharacterized protein BX664DRAFT_326113 [Halteromyces radiatus]|uniref:uncharacterized protein n=1 Tax=Halteromyces radiatus TaxID=101107 RepID=UPI00221F2C83|nr:uncharacterized protein BX664DRAFT_326113 [Halteromyces radiatus]KAI8097318.1 hypothetical protein BX664DRAFT_326113 [Halteromyces radiatus]
MENTKNKKSILRKPTTNNNNNNNNSSSWLSRIQSKLSQQDDTHFQLQRQDLKRVSFSMGHLTTEHTFDEEENDNKQLSSDLETPFLPHCYERACRLREEKEWPFFMEILQTHSFTPLTTIDLSNHTINRSLVGPLADILLLDFGLRILRLSNCGLEDDSIGVLLNSILMSDRLTELDLSQNSFKAKGFKFISIYIMESRQIRSLDISKSSPDRRATHYLSRALLYSTSLQYLHLDQCALKSTHLEILAPGVCRSPSLTSLSLRYNRLSSNSSQWLATLILNEHQTMDMYLDNDDETVEGKNYSAIRTTASTGGLQRLDLTGNALQDIAIGPLCQALYSNRTLLYLSLANCQIYSSGCEMIADALYTNQQLTSLDLSGNLIMHGSDEGIHALKTALLRNDTLQELLLINTDLDATAAITLAEVLPMNATLTRLDLSENPSISLAGVLALAISIKMNNTLTFLDISVPNNDRELSDLQNDIAAVCTTNMIQRIELQRQQQQQEEDATQCLEINTSTLSMKTSLSPSSSSSTSSTTTTTRSTTFHTSTDETEQFIEISPNQRPSSIKIPGESHETPLNGALTITDENISSATSEQAFPLDEISLLDDM